MADQSFVYMPLEDSLRAIGEGRTVGGYVAVFNRETVLGNGVREIIAPGAFTALLEDVRRGVANVYALYNHNKDAILGSTRNGSLRLRQDDVGLYAEVDLPNTTWGNDVLAGMRGKDGKPGLLSGGSFRFLAQGLKTSVVAGVRHLQNLRLAEITITGTPAYPDTNMAVVGARSWFDVDDFPFPDEPGNPEPDAELIARHESLEKRIAALQASIADDAQSVERQVAENE